MKQLYAALIPVVLLVSGLAVHPMQADAQGMPPAPPPVIGAVPPPPPPPPPPPRQLKVYYTVNGQTIGPLNEEELKAKIAAGEVGRQTLVWMEGMTDWQAAATVPAVAPLLVVVPPESKFDAAAFLVGTWEASETIPLQGSGPAQLTMSVTYRSDGTATGFGTMTSQSNFGPFTMAISSQGTWTATAKTDTSFVLTPNMQVTMTGPSGIPSVNTNTIPTLLTVIDRNTVASPSGARSYRVGN
jgi:hypothetical protein